MLFLKTNFIFPVVTVSGFDFEEFLKFTPEKLIILLRLIDSALVRGQEMELMQNNVPFTDKTFASLLATGAVVTSRLIELFTMPEPFDQRAQKSLILIGSGVPEGTTEELSAATLELYFLEGELKVTPTNYEALRRAVDVCTLSFDSNPKNDTELAYSLLETVNAQCLNIVACPQTDCQFDDETKDYYACSCDIVIDTDGNGKVFIATVAYTDLKRMKAKDVQLLGLFQEIEKIQGETGILGLPINSPSIPRLLPRFRDWEEFADLISDALADMNMTNLDVSLDYIPPGVEDPRVELGIVFTHSAAFDVNFDGSLGIGYVSCWFLPYF
jgi:hypothetical protein